MDIILIDGVNLAEFEVGKVVFKWIKECCKEEERHMEPRISGTARPIPYTFYHVRKSNIYGVKYWKYIRR